MREHWDVLGLEEHASDREVKDRYRLLAKRWHPDRFTNDPGRRAQAEARIKLINLAYRAIRKHRDMTSGSFTAGAETGSQQSQSPGAASAMRKPPDSTGPSPVAMLRSEMTLTYLPLSVFALSVAWHLDFIPAAAVSLAGMVLGMSWTLMIWDVSHNLRMPASRRALWIVLLIVAAGVSVPVYFHRYIRPAAA